MDPLLGEIRLFGFDWAPVGWALCQGQIMSITQNTALFSLLGTTYGGDGHSTFALPDLRGRGPVGYGQGPDLPQRILGQSGGGTAQLTVDNLPTHSHTVSAVSTSNGKNPNGAFPAATADAAVYGTDAPDLTMNVDMVGRAGHGQSFDVESPYLALSWCIAVQGVYPQRP